MKGTLVIQTSSTRSRSVSMRILTDDQIWEIKQAAFDIIEKVGFKCRHPGVKKMMTQAGAWVKDDTIKIPKYIVQGCVVTAPKGWTIYDRNGRRALEVEGKKSHYGTSTASPNHRDPFTGDIRPTSINDIALGAKVADALAHIDFVMPMGSAQDVPGAAAEVHEIPAKIGRAHV